MKEFVVKENSGFRLRVKMWKCAVPSDTYTLEFVQEVKDKDGNVEMSSTYQFFLDDLEVQTLCKGMLN